MHWRSKWESGSTPLHRVKDPVVVALLLSYGADIEAKTDDGKTPMHYAAFDRNGEVLTLLLQNGADAGIPDGDGVTPCQYALESEQLEKILSLVCP